MLVVNFSSMYIDFIILVNAFLRRISDLNGPESPFPQLRNIKKMETL